MWGGSVEDGLSIFDSLSFLENEKNKYLLTQ